MRMHLTEGGEGSGNFGHAGRTGQIGGSSPMDSGPVKGEPNEMFMGRTPEDWQREHPEKYINWEIPEKQYYNAKGEPLIEQDPDNSDNVLIYHATSISNLSSIMEKGIVPNVAGVLKKDLGLPKVFLSYSEERAGIAYDYEYRLKEKQNNNLKRDPVAIFKVSVPKHDIQVMRNGDIRVYKPIKPNQFVKVERWSNWYKDGFTFNNSHRTEWEK